MPVTRTLSRLLAAGLGALVCMIPVVVFALPRESVPAVPAPSPFSQEENPGAAYQAAAVHLTRMGFDSPSIRTIWGHTGSALDDQLDDGQLSHQELILLALPNCRADRLDRYVAYAQSSPGTPLCDAVMLVNMGLDQPFYEHIQEISHPDDPLVLVNKYHALPADYTPELEALGYPYGTGSLRPEVAQAFRQMADAAKGEGISLCSVSAYRSYATQDTIYRRYLTQIDQTWVDTFSARPGHSEHQTGLALDINTALTSAHFEETEEFAWLQANCTQYGFLLRYPEDKEYITGYRFEPWHYRYVGAEVAQACADQGLTYEEYVAQLPAGDYRVPTLFWQDDALDLKGGALLLEDTPYLAVQPFIQALNGTTEILSGRLAVTYGGHTLVLSPGHHCLRDGQFVRLTKPALNLDGALYLSLPDLCRLLELEVHSDRPGDGLSLTGPDQPPASSI